MAAATVTEILDNLNDYSDYEEVGSVSRAKSFITAAVRFLALPANEADQGSSAGYSMASVEKLLQHARAYVKANDTSTSNRSSSVRFLTADGGFRR